MNVSTNRAYKSVCEISINRPINLKDTNIKESPSLNLFFYKRDHPRSASSHLGLKASHLQDNFTALTIITH